MLKENIWCKSWDKTGKSGYNDRPSMAFCFLTLQVQDIKWFWTYRLSNELSLIFRRCRPQWGIRWRRWRRRWPYQPRSKLTSLTLPIANEAVYLLLGRSLSLLLSLTLYLAHAHVCACVSPILPSLSLPAMIRTFKKQFGASSDSIAASSAHSTVFLKKLLAVGISNVAYLRGIMSDESFSDRSV